MIRKTLLVIGVAALVAAAFSFFTVRWLARHAATTPVVGVPSLHDLDWLQRELALTAEQRAALATASTRFSETFNGLCIKHCDARLELGNELAKPTPDAARCRSWVDKMNLAQAAAERATLEHILEVRAELTDQQARQYGRLVCDQVCSMNPSSVN